MAKYVTLSTIVVPHAELDDDGKPVKASREWNGVSRDVAIYTNHHHKAGKVVELDKKLAEELLAKKLVRLADPTLDASDDEDEI
jgi:hypothetical protein